MKYYKDAHNNVYALSDVQPVAPGLLPLSPQERDMLVNPPDDLEDIRAAQMGKINKAFRAASAALVADYPPEERLTWPTQQAEALAWDANDNAPTPYLDGVAASRGISEQTMRELTLVQVQLFMAASAALVGKRQRLRDQIAEAETREEIETIAWESEQ